MSILNHLGFDANEVAPAIREPRPNDGGYMEWVLTTPKVATERDERAWKAGYQDFMHGNGRWQIFESDHPSARDYADGFEEAHRDRPEA